MIHDAFDFHTVIVTMYNNQQLLFEFDVVKFVDTRELMTRSSSFINVFSHTFIRKRSFFFMIEFRKKNRKINLNSSRC